MHNHASYDCVIMLLRLRFAVVNIKWDIYDSETARTQLCHSTVMISKQFQQKCDSVVAMRVLLVVRARRERGADCSSVQHPHQTQKRLEKVPFLICMKKCPTPTFTPHWGIHSPKKTPRESRLSKIGEHEEDWGNTRWFQGAAHRWHAEPKSEAQSYSKPHWQRDGK